MAAFVGDARPEMASARRLTQLGAVGALVAAGTFVVGFVMLVTVLRDYTLEDPEPSEAAAFVAEHAAVLQLWQTIILIIFGVALVPLVLALHRRTSDASPTIMPIATVFGFLWAGLVIAAGMIGNLSVSAIADHYDTAPELATSTWLATDAVQSGLGGGNEIVGGMWVILVSYAAMRSARMPHGLGILGIVAGAAGVMTVLPPLEAVGAIFGLGLIVWFVWVATTLLRESAAEGK